MAIWLLIAVEVVFVLTVFGVCYWIFMMSLWPILRHRGGPYVPTRYATVEHMVALAQIKPTDHVVDLGSGDGRLIFAALKAGAASGLGYEINPILVWRSRLKARLKKVSDRAHFVRQSMWTAPLGQVDVLLLYQLSDTMRLLGEKFDQELPAGARIVSHTFRIPGWKPLYDQDQVLLYIKGQSDVPTVDK